jgi:hypothetical protein
MNRMTETALQEFLLPARKKNRAEKETTLKHDPMSEFRNSAYRLPGNGPTGVMLPGIAFKSAMRAVTADMPGATKAAVGRLTFVKQESIPIYGIPQILGTNVRQGGMARTPDIRFRAIFPQWAGSFDVTFQKPLLNENVVASLLAAAGEIVGVGDWRPEKGSGNYGQFRLVDQKEYNAVIKQIGARKEQLKAFEAPICYDERTEKLLEWFENEAGSRGLLRRINGESRV